MEKNQKILKSKQSLVFVTFKYIYKYFVSYKIYEASQTKLMKKVCEFSLT